MGCRERWPWDSRSITTVPFHARLAPVACGTGGLPVSSTGRSSRSRFAAVNCRNLAMATPSWIDLNFSARLAHLVPAEEPRAKKKSSPGRTGHGARPCATGAVLASAAWGICYSGAAAAGVADTAVAATTATAPVAAAPPITRRHAIRWLPCLLYVSIIAFPFRSAVVLFDHCRTILTRIVAVSLRRECTTSACEQCRTRALTIGGSGVRGCGCAHSSLTTEMHGMRS